MNIKDLKGKIHHYINISKYSSDDKGLWLIKGIDVVSGTYQDVVAYALSKNLVDFFNDKIEKIEPKTIQRNYLDKVVAGVFEKEKKDLENRLNELEKEQKEIKLKLKEYEKGCEESL